MKVKGNKPSRTTRENLKRPRLLNVRDWYRSDKTKKSSLMPEVVEDSTGFAEIDFSILSRLINETIKELLSEISRILLQTRIQTQCFDDCFRCKFHPSR